MGTKTASGTSKFACNRSACVFNDFFDSARVIPTPHPPGNAFNSIMRRGVPWHIIFSVVASGKVIETLAVSGTQSVALPISTSPRATEYN